MASSFATFRLPSLPMPKYIPYVPPEPKSKQRRNAKPNPNTKLSVVEDKQPIDDCPIADLGWTHIDDILDGLSDSGTASSAERERHTPSSDPLAVIDIDGEDVRGDPACLSSTAQIHQPSTDKCGYSLAPGVEETDLVLSNLLGGCSPEFPVVVEDDPATANPSVESAECNGTQPPSPVDSLILTTRNRASNVGGGHTATGMDLPSVEGAGGICDVERNEPLSDRDTANLSSVKRKRKHSPSGYTNSSSPEALDLPSEQHFGEPRSAKRRRSLSQPSEDASSSHMLPSEPTFPSPHGTTKINNNVDECVGASDSLSDDVSSCGDGEVQSDGEEVVDDDGASSQVRATAAVPQPQPGNSHKSQDRMSQDGSSQGGLRDYHGSKRRQKSTTSLPGPKPSSSSSRGGADTHLTHGGRASFKAKSRCKKLRCRRRGEIKGDVAVPATTFPTPPPAGNACEIYNRNAADALSEHSDYQLTDVTHCQVPADASLVTAIVRGDGGMPKPSEDGSEMLVHALFGNTGKLVRMVELGSDSWLLVGYRCSLHNVPSCSAGRGTTQGRRSNSRSRHDKAGNVDDGDNGRTSKCDRALHTRTHQPWSKSDEQRLLAYKHKMCMEWADIFPRFPDRTPEEVRAHWYMLLEPPLADECEDLDAFEYEIQQLLKRRTNERTGKLQYFVKWKGWGPSHNEWYNLEDLQNALDLVKECDEREDRLLATRRKPSERRGRPRKS